MFTYANAYISGDIEAGMFYFVGKFSNGTTLSIANEALDEVIEELKNDLVSDYETQKLRNKFETKQMTDYMVLMDFCSELAYFELLGDANWINDHVEQYRTVTSMMGRQFARDVFRKENCSTLFYKSKQH